MEILASTASIFAQILALKPPNLEIFGSQALKLGNFQFTSPQFWKFTAHKPLFQRQVSVRKPLTSEIRAVHPYLKKVEPPGSVLLSVVMIGGVTRHSIRRRSDYIIPQ